MTEVVIRELPLPILGGLLHSWIPVGFPELLNLPPPIIVINTAEKFYSENIGILFFHETIHNVLLRLEGDETSDKFDNLFPTLYETRCLIDGNFERHMIWRLRHAKV